jgi:type II secretory pathway pseudopilin PulG
MKDNSSAGFSYIDVMIAIVILMVGILALIAAISASMLISRGQEQQLNAKQYLVSTMESIMSAKETAPEGTDLTPLGWNAIGNVGSNIDPATGQPRGVFVTGVQEVRQNAGPDEIIGTFDDTGPVVPGLARQIVITDLCDPDRPSAVCPVPGTFPVRNRMVTVTMTYFAGSIRRQEELRTILTDYAVVN